MPTILGRVDKQIDWNHQKRVQRDTNDLRQKGEQPMNRLPASGFALVLVLLLLSPALAQKSSPGWKTLKPGVQVLKLWDKIGPEQPQIAIFQLSSEAYKDFQQDPKAFVDGYMIFGELVRPGVSLTELLSAPKGYSGEWTAPG